MPQGLARDAEDVRRLLNAGADVSSPFANKETPVEVAEREGYKELAAYLRKREKRLAGGGEQRINTALSVGGPEALIQTIDDYFGIEINHYLQMDFLGFKELVAAVELYP